jgi:hypothetical protein
MRLEDFDNDEDKIIQDRLKTWNEIHWKIARRFLRSCTEFVNGYETMGRIGPCVSILGQLGTKPEDKYYQLAERIAYKISKAGYAWLRAVVLELEAGNGEHLGGEEPQ